MSLFLHLLKKMTNKHWGNKGEEESFKMNILKSTSGFGDTWIHLPTDNQGKPPSWPTCEDLGHELPCFISEPRRLGRGDRADAEAPGGVCTHALPWS